jgi:hypothetical protein
MPTAAIPRGQQGPPLPARTLAVLTERPPAVRALVHRVWTTLTELHQSGRHPHPRALAALLADVIDHQPSRTGRCRAYPRCHRWHPRWSWQRPLFPCIIWITTDFTLHGPPFTCDFQSLMARNLQR